MAHVYVAAKKKKPVYIIQVIVGNNMGENHFIVSQN